MNYVPDRHVHFIVSDGRGDHCEVSATIEQVRFGRQEPCQACRHPAAAPHVYFVDIDSKHAQYQWQVLSKLRHKYPDVLFVRKSVALGLIEDIG